MSQPRKPRPWAHPRSLLRTILMLDDTPHSIALGTAIGMFIGMTPTVGVQMLIVMLVGLVTWRMFHFNRVAALIAVYVSNPLTVVPIYWFDYKVGTLFFSETVGREEFSRIFEYNGFSGWLSAVGELCLTVGAPLIVGSLVVASICAAVTYPAIWWILHQIRREPFPGPPAAESRETAAVGRSGD